MMKKYFIYTLAILVFPLLNISCDTDNNDGEKDPEIPVEPTPTNATNEVKLVFKATTNNNTASFYIEGEKFSIDWGDGKVSTQTDVDQESFIRNKYASNKEYLITISTDKELRLFKNFSAANISNFEEETIPIFESITIGEDVEIAKLYIQTSGVKKVSFAKSRDDRFGSAEVLLGADNWDLSVLKGSKLSIYAKRREQLEAKNLNVNNLSVAVEGNLTNLVIDNCNNLRDLTIIGKAGGLQHVENINISNLPKLSKLQAFSLKGSKMNLSHLSVLRTVTISGFDFETIDMDKINSSADNVSFDSSHLRVSKSILWGNSFEEVRIDNKEATFSSDVAVLDFSQCNKLRFLDIRHLKNLEQIKFGEKDSQLSDAFLLDLPKLATLDFSTCESLIEVVGQELAMLETAKFSSNNKFLSSLWFEKVNFSVESFITMISSLPNTPISELPKIEKPFLNIRDNQVNLSNNAKINDAIAALEHWSVLID